MSEKINHLKMEQLSCRVFLNVGDLLKSLPRSNLSSHKEKDLLTTVQNNFKSITGIEVDPRKFRSVLKKYTAKIKKNNSRVSFDELFCDWFADYLGFNIESDSDVVKDLIRDLASLPQLPQPSLQLPSLPPTTRETSLPPSTPSSRICIIIS